MKEKLDKGSEQRIQELELEYVTLANEHLGLQKENEILRKQIKEIESESQIAELLKEIEDLKRINQSLVEEFATSLR